MVNQNHPVLSLKDIVQYELPAILRRQHLNRDVVTGFVGDRGSGKSLSAAVISILDYMVQNEPCFSNMDIAITFDIPEEISAKYKLAPGSVTFKSQLLDKVKYLTFNEEYQGGVFLIDEYNIFIADARRSMSNQNLQSDDVSQQLRKLESALLFTCIHEMFVDSRVRDMTDIYVRCKDTALTKDGLDARKKQGVDIEWIIYPMTMKLTGESYNDTAQALAPVYFHAQQFWGIIDTRQRQERKKYQLNKEMLSAQVEITKDPNTEKWTWLRDSTVINEMKTEGGEIRSDRLYEALLDEMPPDFTLSENELTEFIIQAFNPRWHSSGGKKMLKWDKPRGLRLPVSP